MSDVSERNHMIIELCSTYREHIEYCIFSELRCYDMTYRDDLLSELVLEISKHWSRLKGLEEPQIKKWLRTVIHHKAADRYSSKHIKRTAYKASDQLDDAYYPTDPQDALMIDMSIALHKLKEHDPHLYELVFYHYALEYTFAELAVIYRMNTSTVKRKIYRGMRFLRKELNYEK